MISDSMPELKALEFEDNPDAALYSIRLGKEKTRRRSEYLNKWRPKNKGAFFSRSQNPISKGKRKESCLNGMR